MSAIQGAMEKMSTDTVIGLVVPNATDEVSPEGRQLYPDVRFLARGVGVQGLSAEGFHAAWEAIVPAAEQLAADGVSAIMLMGTSLTFHRGYAAHERLVEDVRSRTGLPVSTMSRALVDGLLEVGAKSVLACARRMPTRSTIVCVSSWSAAASRCWRCADLDWSASERPAASRAKTSWRSWRMLWRRPATPMGS